MPHLYSLYFNPSCFTAACTPIPFAFACVADSSVMSPHWIAPLWPQDTARMKSLSRRNNIDRRGGGGPFGRGSDMRENPVGTGESSMISISRCSGSAELSYDLKGFKATQGAAEVRPCQARAP